MQDWLGISFILGMVQGLTEFLPVSSTGHLILVGDLLGFTGAKASTFEVAIQLGSIFAVVVLYWPRFWGLLFPKQAGGLSGWRGLGLLFLTSLPPASLGLLLHGQIKTLFSVPSVVLALATGAILMLVMENYVQRHKPKVLSLDSITPALALGIGVGQCLALWPGFSRSASTIMTGMFLGLQRATAAEYSFIAAVPLMFAATAYDFVKSWHIFSAADIPFFACGMFFSFIFAMLAIKTFILLLGKLTLRPFAWYRLALAGVCWYFLV